MGAIDFHSTIEAPVKIEGRLQDVNPQTKASARTAGK